MSSGNTVDSKIVELQFNNQNFESNANTSISTLDKLKKALNFSSTASKNFDEMNASLHKIDVASVSNGVNTLKNSLNDLKNIVVFSWIADEAIKAKNAVEGFIKSVTIDQVRSGWDKYAEKTSAVQTIMSATAEQFSDTETQMEAVNAQLDKLNWFTDETSFNFVDMVNNIGKFTSNNVGLDQSVTAMQGISTWAAKSGANVQEASRAMYNLSQAMAVGSVKLMDWKSIENANMATTEFKKTAMETAASLGTLKKNADGTFSTLKGHTVTVETFNQNLSDEWFSSQALLDTLDKYGNFTNKLYETMENVDEAVTTSKMLEYIDQFKDGSIDLEQAAKNTGMSTTALKEALADLSTEEMEFGRKAFAAAQEAKTFEEAVESVKDAVSTGWMNTFEIMFGDYLQAKTLWTGLANDLYEIFAEGGNARNALLKEAFGYQTNVNAKDWALLEKAGLASPEFLANVQRNARMHKVYAKMTATDEEWLQTVLDRGLITMEDLNDAYSKVFGGRRDVDEELLSQIKAAKETDDTFKELLSTIDKYSAEDLDKVIFGNGKYEEGYEELEKVLDTTIEHFGLSQEEGKKLVDVLASMKEGSKDVSEEFAKVSDEELKALDLTDQEIAKLRKAQEEGKLTADMVWDIIQSHHMTGEQLWFDSLTTGMSNLLNMISLVKEAWSDIFPDLSATGLYEMLQGLHSAVTGFRDLFFEMDDNGELVGFTEQGEQLKNVFEGVFAVVDLVVRTIGTLGKMGIGVIRGLLSGLGIDILKLASYVGEAAISFRSWVVDNDLLGKALTFVSSKATSAGQKIRSWGIKMANAFNLTENIDRFRTAFKSAFVQAEPYVKGFPEILDRFKNKVKELGGLKFDNLLDIFGAFKDTVIDYIINFPGFKSIKAAFSLLWSDIQNGLKDMGIDLSGISDTFGSFGKIAQTAFSYAGTAAKAAWEFIKNLFTSFTNLPIVQNAITNFGNAFNIINENIDKFTDGAKGAIDGFIEKVKGMEGGVSLENLGAIFETFRDDVVSYFTNFEGFQALKDAFGSLKDDIKAALADVGIDVDGIKERITNFVDGIKEALEAFEMPKTFQDFLNIFKKGGEADESTEEAGEQVETFADKIKSAFDKIKAAIAGIDFKPIIGLVTALLLFKSTKFVFDIFKSYEALIAAKASEANARKLLALAIVLGILAAAIYAFSKIDTGQLIKGGIAVAALMLAVLGFSYAFSKLGDLSGMKTAAESLVMMAGSLLILVIALKLIETLDGSAIEANAKYVVGAMVIIGVIVALASHFAGEIKNLGAAFAGLGAAFLLFAIAMKIIQNVLNTSDEGQIWAILGIMAAIGAIITVISIFAKKLDGALGAFVGLGILFVAMAAAMWIVKKVVSGMELGDYAMMLGAMVAIGAIIAAILHFAGNLQGATGAIIALAFLFGVLTAAVAIIGFMPLENAIQGAGILVVLTAVLALAFSQIAKIETKGALSAVFGMILLMAVFVIALYAMDALGIENAITNAAALAILAVGIAAAFWIFSKVGAGAEAAAGAMLSAAASIGIIVGVVAAIGIVLGLLDKITGGAMQDIAKRATAILSELGTAIGSFFGNILGSFNEGLLATLPEIGAAIKGFMDNMQGVKPVGTEGIAAFGEILLAILGIGLTEALASLGDAVSEMTTGKTTVQLFSENLKELADGLSTWEESMGTINELNIPFEGIDNLMNIIDKLSLQGMINSIETRIAEWASGKSSVELFTENIEGLAEALTSWQTSMDSIGTITVPEDAIDSLVESLEKIPGSGLFDTISNFFNGVPNLDAFKENLVALGDGMKSFSTTLGSDFDAASIATVADACTSLAGIGKALKGQHLKDTWLGGEGILKQFATAIIDFANELKGLADVEIDVAQLSSFAEATSTLSTTVSTFSQLDLSSGPIMDSGLIEQFKSGLQSIKEAIEDLADMNTSGVSKLKGAVSAIGQTDLSTAVNQLNNAKSLNESKSQMNASGSEMGSALVSGLNSQAGAVSGALSTLVSDARAAISVDEFSTTGTEIVNALANAVSGNSSLSAAMRSICSAAVSSASGYSGHFTSTGRQLVAGFANGITSAQFMAMAAARAMALAALNAAKQAIAVSSPSKEAYKVGNFFGMGFTNAIDDNVSGAYKSGYSMADSARKGLTRAASLINDIISSDMDVQPVVRPVLDLSDIENGAGSIGRMLNMQPIAISGNIGAISNNVNGRSMVSNADVVSAISALRKSLGSNLGGGDTYNIAGITYDDGSNVSTAVRDLIRETRVRRKAGMNG